MKLKDLTKAQLIEKIKKDQKDFEAFKQTVITPEVLQEKIQVIEKQEIHIKDLEQTIESLQADTSTNQHTKQTHFLVPGALGEKLVGVICQSLHANFIGESHIVVFGDEETPIAEALAEVVQDEATPNEFVFIPSPCVAINAFSLSDLKILKSKKNGDFDTGLPVVFGKENLIDLGELDSIEDLINAYFAAYSGNEIAMKILDVGPDNLKCGVYRTNPRMDLVQNALISKKFYCFNEKGYQALQPILDELYPKSEKEE